MDNKKLIRAKVGIILTSPFFATLMMRKEFVEDYSIETAYTDGKKIAYNPQFFDGLPEDELKGVIVHEIMHPALLHHTRRNGRDLRQWNEACDYAINGILLNSGFSLPECRLHDARFANMSAEAIYSALGRDKQDDQGDDANDDGEGQEEAKNSDPGGCGGVEDAPVKSEAEIAEAEAQAKQELAQAIQVAKMQGKLPAGIERIVNEILNPKVIWQEVLSRFVSEAVKNDYSFSKPNTRYLSSGFILPSLYNVELGSLVLMVDTSGSIDEEVLNTFATEMQEAASMSNSTIKVLYVDSEVAGDQDIEPDDTFKLEPKGGGGTDFRPGFDWLAENGLDPKIVVYFTDGYCSSFPEEPECPVLWAVYNNSHFRPPFGEVVCID